MQSNSKPLGKAATTALMIAAAMATRKSTAKVWDKASEKPVPPQQDNEEVTLREAITWAVVSGTAVGLARFLARRFVAFRGSPTGGRES